MDRLLLGYAPPGFDIVAPKPGKAVTTNVFPDLHNRAGLIYQIGYAWMH